MNGIANRMRMWLLTGVLASIAATATAGPFTLTPIDVPGESSPLTEAFGINDAGQIVGFFVDSTGRNHGFLRNADGTFTTIDVPGVTGTSASDINDAGHIVGSGEHAFLDVGGTFTLFDVPGALGTVALGINNADHIVGSFLEPTAYRGFLATPTGGTVPEPATLALVGIGLLGLLTARRHSST